MYYPPKTRFSKKSSDLVHFHSIVNATDITSLTRFQDMKSRDLVKHV